MSDAPIRISLKDQIDWTVGAYLLDVDGRHLMELEQEHDRFDVAENVYKAVLTLKHERRPKGGYDFDILEVASKQDIIDATIAKMISDWEEYKAGLKPKKTHLGQLVQREKIEHWDNIFDGLK